MRKISIQFLFTLVINSTVLMSQGMWVQTQSAPEGAGITDMLITEPGTILVTTASYNYPAGYGGVRRSTDDGNTWINVLNGYTGRTLAAGSNGVYFASFWNYPSNEGLYVSVNDGQTWANRYYLAASNNNIFTILPTNNNMTIFLGTRTGVLRSTDGGISFPQSNNGIPPNSWVRDLDISQQGIIAAGTTNGAFISTNNGSSWQQVTGISPGDTIVKVSFIQFPADDIDEVLEMGTQSGRIYKADSFSGFFEALTTYIFNDDPEISGLLGQLVSTFLVSTYPNSEKGGGIFQSNDGGHFFNGVNGGLPDNPKVSTIAENQIYRDRLEQVEIYCGLFENSQNGAKVFKRSFTIGVHQISSDIPTGFALMQNYPNPFNPSTKLRFSIPAFANVRITIFNAVGSEIDILLNKKLNAGIYEVDWNASEFSSGVYFYRIKVNEFTETRKMVLLK